MNYLAVGTGGRKSSKARVFIKKGQGEVTINKRPISDVYNDRYDQYHSILSPLAVINQLGEWDVMITAKGGGITGQAEAIRMALARALCQYEANQSSTQNDDEEGKDSSIKQQMRRNGFITRDARKVERSKVGFHGSRRRPQYSKR